MNTQNTPSLEEVVEAVRTLDMVRTHVRGFGELKIIQSVKRGRGRVVEARLCLGNGRHAQYVRPELAEIVQPAADVLMLALRDWRLTINSDANPMTVTVRA